jgi:hypothetical protein
MLAYTALDGLRVISRDFDFDWQPEVGEPLSTPRRNWRTSFGDSRRLGRNALWTLAGLVPFGVAWLR